MCVSLRNQKCMTQLTLINLPANEYCHEFYYYQISGGVIIRNFNVSVQNVIYVKKIIFGIILHVVVKMENI